MKNHKDKLYHLTQHTNVSWRLWTPEEAQKILEKNNNNRRAVKKNVDQICKALKEDTFYPNGETIVFSDKGELLDGRHRLLGCVKSGSPFISLTVEGLPKEVMPYFDIGSNRTPSHLLQIHQKRGIAAALRKYYLLDKCWKTKCKFDANNLSSMSQTDLLDLADKKGEISEYCYGIVNSKSVPGNNCSPPAEFAALYMHLCDRDKEVADSFFLGLVYGENLSDRDTKNPIVYLRQKLASSNDTKGIKSNEMFVTDKVWVTIKAFNLWYEGKKVKHNGIKGSSSSHNIPYFCI